MALNWTPTISLGLLSATTTGLSLADSNTIDESWSDLNVLFQCVLSVFDWISDVSTTSSWPVDDLSHNSCRVSTMSLFPFNFVAIRRNIVLPQTVGLPRWLWSAMIVNLRHRWGGAGWISRYQRIVSNESGIGPEIDCSSYPYQNTSFSCYRPLNPALLGLSDCSPMWFGEKCSEMRFLAIFGGEKRTFILVSTQSGIGYLTGPQCGSARNQGETSQIAL